jgi:hypothetical protein
MDDLTSGGLVVIVSCVFLGWLTSVYVIEGRLNLGAPVIYGTSQSLLLARLVIWSAVIGFAALSMIAVSFLVPEVTALAILFGLQAMLFDFCSRIRFLDYSRSDRSSNWIVARWPRHF